MNKNADLTSGNDDRATRDLSKTSPNHPQARLCRRCKKIVDRTDLRGRKHDPEARVSALKRAWDGSCFRCYYAGIQLVEDNQHDPRYLTLDHRVPNREDDIVVAALLINHMKSNMTEDEFRAMVQQLASRFNDGPLMRVSSN